MKYDELKPLKNLEVAFNRTTGQEQVIAEDSEGNCYGFDSWEEVYIKYEADKVIALLTDKANYNEYAYKFKSEELADTCRFYEDEIRRQKHKRCLRNAEGCKNKAWFYGEVHDRNAALTMWKWRKRWLELAEKFKEAK